MKRFGENENMASFKVTNLLRASIFVLTTVGTCLSELRLLQSVFNHGNRYPLPLSTVKVIYPLMSPYPDSWKPDAPGRLTITGKRKAYELGQALRKRYGEWFEGSYYDNFVEFISAGNESTMMTTSLVAAGLFPPNNSSQRWNRSYKWQHIPIWPINRYPEIILFYGSIYCQKYLDLLEKTRRTDSKIIDYDGKMSGLYEFVSRHIGARVDNRILYYLYQEFQASVNARLNTPEWADKIFHDGSLKKAAILEYQYSSWTNELKRLTGGIWLEKWLDYVDDYLGNAATDKSTKTYKIKTRKRAFFYGGYDGNIAGIMMTLGIFSANPHIPNYASVINFELHEDEKQRFYVKVVYRNSDEFIDYVIPGCDDILCPLETFKNLFSNVLPSNAIKDCGYYGPI